ncbi:intersectin-2 [Planoprotostelium fungivorum]|uniref:Intersectin-2 n=1 Tax=Planoprotostelium fungivorum TaxID=1890364 RepID=A0A2P6NJU2_9EUKA|nr:intersectin-2 [Planoprotostelium fungivorum]
MLWGRHRTIVPRRSSASEGFPSVSIQTHNISNPTNTTKKTIHKMSEQLQGPTIALVRAIREHKATNPSEMNLVIGQIYHVKSIENGICRGISLSGQSGHFPMNCTEEVANLSGTRQQRAATIPIAGAQPLHYVNTKTETNNQTATKKPLFGRLLSQKKKGDLFISEPTYQDSTAEPSSAAPSMSSIPSSSYDSSPSYSQQQQKTHLPSTSQMSYAQPPTLPAQEPMSYPSYEEEQVVQDEEFYAIAITSCQNRPRGQLSYSEGEYIVVKERLPTNWWRGHIYNQPERYGLFRDSTVQIIDADSMMQDEDELEDLPDSVPTMVRYGSNSNNASPAERKKPQVSAPLPAPIITRQEEKEHRAIFSFEAKKETQLSLMKGETIMVRERRDGGWWSGYSQRLDREGLFPSTYVREMDRETDAQEQLDKMAAKMSSMTAKYEERIKQMTQQMEQLNRAATSE